MPTTAERLRAAGLRVTAQRTAVLDVLSATSGQHLNVSATADLARARLGNVSTQAVYNCLDVLVRAGLANRVEPAGHPARFEARVGDDHHHLVCRRCGVVRDVDCALGAPPCLTPVTDHGFTFETAEVTYWGTCPSCAAEPRETLHKKGPSHD